MIEIKKTGMCKDCNHADLYLDSVTAESWDGDRYNILCSIHCRHEAACIENENVLHELLQDAIDAGIITETQASRLMDRIAEDNT